MFTCENCNKQYLKEGSLIKHKMSCNRTFICDGCNKEFKTKQALERHQNTCATKLIASVEQSHDNKYQKLLEAYNTSKEKAEKYDIEKEKSIALELEVKDLKKDKEQLNLLLQEKNNMIQEKNNMIQILDKHNSVTKTNCNNTNTHSNNSNANNNINYIVGLKSINEQHMLQTAQASCSEVKNEEEFAKFFIEQGLPFLVTDASRNNLVYKDNNKVIKDSGGNQLTAKVLDISKPFYKEFSKAVREKNIDTEDKVVMASQLKEKQEYLHLCNVVSGEDKQGFNKIARSFARFGPHRDNVPSFDEKFKDFEKIYINIRMLFNNNKTLIGVSLSDIFEEFVKVVLKNNMFSRDNDTITLVNDTDDIVEFTIPELFLLFCKGMNRVDMKANRQNIFMKFIPENKKDRILSAIDNADNNIEFFKGFKNVDYSTFEETFKKQIEEFTFCI